MDDRQDDNDDGIGTLISRTIADGRAYAQAELGYWRALAVERLADARSAAIFAIVAVLLAQAAAIALIVGSIMILTPHVGPGLATLIVVLIAAFAMTLSAFAALRFLKRLMRPRNTL